MNNNLVSWMCAALGLMVTGGCASVGPTVGPRHLIVELGGVGLCQSPVNISSTMRPEGHHEIHLDYLPSTQRIINKGHTVELDYDSGSTVTFDGEVYEFRQFHFHTPSEHQIDGITYPMEMHLVHTLQGDDQQYLVGAILWREGEANGFLAQFLDAIPADPEGQVVREKTIDVRQLLGDELSHYTYRGSLTTPPYTETVRWLVLRGIRTASREQIQRLRDLEGNNARHIQPLAGRSIESE